MPQPSPTAPLVLIADNDVGISALLYEILVERGIRCESVYDGELAWARLRAGGVEVLVTDLDMPRLTGRELIERLGDLPTPPRTLVISGFMEAGLAEELAALPAVRHILRKPFDIEKFADLVQEMLADETSRAGS